MGRLKGPTFKRPNLKRKGRYVLLALALLAGGRVALNGHKQTASLPRDCVRTAAFEAAPPPPAALSGRLGLWVARLDPQTSKPLAAVARDPDGVYPLASAYKQAVLWALLREVDAGQVKLSETFEVDHAAQSLGRYPFDGSNVTTLMSRMIHNSDNTATDLLHRRVGLEAVQGVADRLKLCRTRLILPTKDWWVAQAGLDPNWPQPEGFGGATGEARLALARSLDAAARNVRADVVQVRLDDYFARRYDPATDLNTHNVSTPFEFADLIAHEFLASGLSSAQRERQRDVMATGFGRSRLRAPVTYFGGKGGNGWKILTMTGYFETPQGQHVVYVFMQHGAREDETLPNIHPAFAWINAAVERVLAGPVASTSSGRTPLPTRR